MKPLILSFFVVILGYSLFFDDEKKTLQPIQTHEKSVYIDMPSDTQKVDSIVIYEDEFAYSVREVYSGISSKKE